METLSTTEIRQKISDYFGDVEHKIDIETIGNISDIRVWYKDFKPSKEVRNDISNMSSNIDNIDVFRDYSISSSFKAICSIISEHPVMYIKDGDKYIPIRIPEMIKSVLFDKEL